MAPEVLAERDYTTHSDIYSLGLLYWELLTAAGPFDEFRYPFTPMLQAAIVAGLRPTLPDAPAGYVALVRSMWAAEPHERPAADRVLAQLEGLARAMLHPRDANLICNADWLSG